jgi:hypothetical protein
VHGAVAFTGGQLLLPHRGAVVRSALSAAASRRSLARPPAVLRRPSGQALRMQNAPDNMPNPVDLLVKSKPSSREGIDLFVGEDAAAFDWANEKWGALGERGW